MTTSDDYMRVRPLAALGGQTPQPQAWMATALAQQPEKSFVQVAGAAIEMLCWGKPGAPGLLFVHGNGAHAHWWSHIAPFFAKDWRCAAFSLSGMGGSDHRDHYTLDLYADEIAAVIEAAGLARSGTAPVVVAHSFGGLLAMQAGGRPGLVAGIIAIDAAVFQDIMRGEPDQVTYRHSEVFADSETALARFRLRPHQPITDAYIVHSVARQALAELPDGSGRWTWRADPFIRRDIVQEDVAAIPGAVRCPVFLIWGGKSALSARPGAIDLLRSRLPAGTPQITIPEAGHHIMLDYPLELVAALRAILASWPPAEAPPSAR